MLLETLTLFQTKICDLTHPILDLNNNKKRLLLSAVKHTQFQTRLHRVHKTLPDLISDPNGYIYTQFQTRLHRVHKTLPDLISDPNGYIYTQFLTKRGKKPYPLAPHIPI